AVFPRLRAGYQHAAIPIDLDRLRAAPGRRCNDNIVPTRLQTFDGGCRRAGLDICLFTFEEEARRVDCGLDVHAEVDRVHDDLYVAHRLIMRAHHAETHVTTSVAHGECRNDRMHRTFVR